MTNSAELSAHRPKIGLVLGAGGVRGTAHAGVLSVLRDAGVPIDLVVGSSVGSLFGLGIAAGLPTEFIARVAREGTPFELFRFYAGRLRPTPRNSIGRMLFEAGYGRNFEDLEIPFAVQVTDMATGQVAIIDRGPVLPAVQASMALPFIARPVALDGAHYVDGGMMDTAPVAPARRMGADRVIAVCLGNNYTAPEILRRRPWTRPILERVGQQRQPVRGHLRDQVRFGLRLYAACFDPPPPAQGADVTITPTFVGVRPNAMVGGTYCFHQGVSAAREALPHIMAMLNGSSLPQSTQETMPHGFVEGTPLRHPSMLRSLGDVLPTD